MGVLKMQNVIKGAALAAVAATAMASSAQAAHFVGNYSVTANTTDPGLKISILDLPGFLGEYRGTSVALAGDARRSLYEVDLRGPVAILVGNEGAGLTAAARNAAKVRARIPMPGRAESLNASVAGSVALFEAVRQRAGARSR